MKKSKIKELIQELLVLGENCFDRLCEFSGPGMPSMQGDTMENSSSWLLSQNSSSSTEQARPIFDIFIHSHRRNDRLIGQIKQALPSSMTTLNYADTSQEKIRHYLDGIQEAVITLLDGSYVSDSKCLNELVYIFKTQLPLILIIDGSDELIRTRPQCLDIILNASTTKIIRSQSSDFSEKLRAAIIITEQYGSPSELHHLDMRKPEQNQSKRFIGDILEWTKPFRNPVEVGDSYRRSIRDPLRLKSDVKLRDFYYRYARCHISHSEVIKWIGKGMNENNVEHFIQAYTTSSGFSTILNQHLASHVLKYFDSKLYEEVDYRMIRCLIDFIALIMYRKEFSSHKYCGTVYRGVEMTKSDLDKYIVGCRIMNTTFLSTSKNKEVAEMFSGENQAECAVLCKLQVRNHGGRRTALNIQHLSKMEDEEEVLILPFTAFRVEKKGTHRKQTKYIPNLAGGRGIGC